MKISALEAYGIDEQVLDVWKNSGHDQLLPIQIEAVRQGKVLEGKNVVIFSPTSSGKTFVGEMAAVRVARQKRRAIYLVPQKALAEEKYREFKRSYSGLGIRVVISTRDHKEHDSDIRNGQFHIAVVVYEKMQGLLVVSPHLLSKMGVVVIDELQMIGDRSRGADLEILLTKIKTSARTAQIIGLSAVLGSSEQLARWLGAHLCKTTKRPVELRKGVLCQNQFRYLEHNSGETGVEDLGAGDVPEDETNMLLHQASQFAQAGESCLVFCKTKQECIQMASRIAHTISLPPAEKALAEMHLLEESAGKDILAQVLERGVAYHNADLDWDQRDIVERYFRKGEIKVICATSTLAMGLNLPARNVFLDPQRWDQDDFGNWSLDNISQSEYENMSGRAGRFGLEKDFGRAIIVTDSPFDSRSFFDLYVKGQLADVKPALARDTLAQHALNLVASKLCKTPSAVRDLLLNSYTGEMLWRGDERERQFTCQLKEGIRHCLDGGLLARSGKTILATPLGRVAAVKGISVDTAIQMAAFGRTHADHAAYVSPLQVILCLSKTQDGEDVHFNLSTQEYESDRYLELLKQAVAEQPPIPKQCLASILRLNTVEYDRAKRAKKVLIVHDWVNGVPTREIEKRYHCLSGSIVGLATEYSWLAEAFAFIARCVGWQKKDAYRMLKLSEQMLYGVPQSAVEIVKAKVRGVGRGRAMLLVENELNSLEKVIAAQPERLAKLLSKPVAMRLVKRATLLLQEMEVRRLTGSGHTSVEGKRCVAGNETREAVPPAAKAWAEEFPPSDAMGISYQSEARVQIDGRCQKRRYHVLVDDQSCWLGESSFRAMLQLAVAAREGGLGWLSFDRLGSPETYHQVIRRLKKDLAGPKIDVDDLIENNRSKQYRLSVPPRCVTIDRKMVLMHYPEAGGILPELASDMPPDKTKQIAG